MSRIILIALFENMLTGIACCRELGVLVISGNETGLN